MHIVYVYQCVVCMRHVQAFHCLPEIGEDFLQEVCAAAAALPRLISLHLVRTPAAKPILKP
jgi:hypothetical protein